MYIWLIIHRLRIFWTCGGTCRDMDIIHVRKTNTLSIFLIYFIVIRKKNQFDRTSDQTHILKHTHTWKNSIFSIYKRRWALKPFASAHIWKREGRGKIGLVQRADKFRKSYEPLKCRNILFRLSNDNNLKRILLEYLSISLSKFL